MARRDLIAALDIGSSKICCFIGRQDGEDRVQITGIGHQASRGIKAGAIVDMDAAEESIMAAVHTAERMADETIRDVTVGLAGGQQRSQLVDMQSPLNGGPVRDTDLRRLLYGGLPDAGQDRALLHAIPVGYSIDGSNGIRDPRGMHGQSLAVHVHQVTAATSAIRNVTTCVERCHLNVVDVVSNSYAAGLAALVSDEIELGVTVLDMGGGSTSIAVFVEGSPVYSDCVPVGGIHVTSDIARGLATPLAHAERLKTLHGSAIPSHSDDRETVVAPQIGEEDNGEPNHVPKSYLVSIIAPRVEETLELVRDRLVASGISQVAGRRVVLVGGASQLPGVPELTARILDKQVRIGRPAHIGGLAEATSGPAFAACAGLMRYSDEETGDLRAHAVARPAPGEGLFARFGPLARMGGWLRENL